MALEKKNLNIPFAEGLDLKTDPKQLSHGKFLVLENKVFTKGNLLTKRTGFPELVNLGVTDATSITTYNDNLVATGNSLYAFSPDTNSIINKGTIVPINLAVKSVVRTSSAQQTVDTAVSSSGLICTVWEDADGSKYYEILDSNNGNVLVEPTALPTGCHFPRVFMLGGYFVITFLITITATPHLRYIAVPVMNTSSPTAATDISTQVSTNTAAYDGQIIDGILYISWDGSDGGGAVRATYLDNTLIQHNTIAIAATNARLISVVGDTSGNSPVIWISWVNAANNSFSAAYNSSLIVIRAKTAVLTTIVVVNLTGTATGNVLTTYYSTSNTYSYNTVRSDFMSKITINTAGTVGSPTVILRSVGLASKAFLRSTTAYMLVAYGGTYEPTYFLMDGTGKVVCKLAFSNGSYPSTQILANFNQYGDAVSIGYLFKAQVTALNKTQGVATVAGLYGQLGINLATFTFASSVQSLEVGGALHMNGGYLRMYDGTFPVEHNFHLYPEDLGFTSATTGGGLKAQQYYYQATYEWTDSQGNIHRSAPSIALSVNLASVTPTALTFTSIFLTGVSTITVSSATGLHVGQVITDNTTGANITAGTTITAISGTSVTLSLPTAGNSGGGGDTLQTVNTLAVTLKVPYLRITEKTGANKVRLVAYRWSTAQQNYYQTTSISSPTVNVTSSDSASISDLNNDAEIIGNPLIYTTGGVVENIAAPPCNAMTLYQSRLLLIDAEDTNLVWYSKQVIENTPVEMSDLFTEFVTPTISAKISTGPVSCLFSMDDKRIFFKRGAIYYGTGKGPDNTGANNDLSEPTFITSTVGSENQSSLAFMPQGIMFESDKGIWLLGRDLSTTYIGSPVETLTQDATVLSAVTVPETNEVRFTLDSGFTLMYDYYYNQWGTFKGIPSISSTIYNNKHTILNDLGQILEQSSDTYLDNANPVLIKLTTGWMNLAGLQGFERAYGFYLLGQFITPHKLQIGIAYDYDPSVTQTIIISPDNFSPAYGGDSLYGSSSPYGGPSRIEQWKVFFQRQKCQSFQITITEIYDPTDGVVAGAGLTISGIDLELGLKSGVPRLSASRSVG